MGNRRYHGHFQAGCQSIHNYQHVAEEVNSLQTMINKAAQHFQSTTLSDSDRQEGQNVLNGCQSILGDLDSLLEKHNSLASTNPGQAFQRVMLGTEDIATLRARLTSNATLLSSFIRRLDASLLRIWYMMLIFLP